MANKVKPKEEKKIPLQDAEKLAQEIMRVLNPHVQFIMEAGSVRRQCPEVADIDFVAWPKSAAFREKCEQMSDSGLLWEGERKLSFIFKDTQVDFMFIKEPMELPAMMLHFTGSASNNIRMRRHAKDRGLKLNEYGLWQDDIRVNCKSERDIYEALNLPYQPSEERG